MTNPRSRRRHNRFSLVEILIVLVIIGLVLGLVGPALIKHLEEGKRKTAKSQLLLLKSCIKSYYLDVGDYPSALQDLVQSPPGAENWKGPYIEDGALPLDPWGNNYIYQKPGTDDRPYDLLSYGKDNAPGGDGSDADITTWDK